MQSEKIKEIELSYSGHTSFKVEDLEHRKHWEEGRVYDFGIKWNMLWIRLDNEKGEVLEEEVCIDGADENIDWKRPTNIMVDTGDILWHNLNDYINLTREVKDFLNHFEDNLGREN